MAEPRTCDVLVIGGGATGAGILRDAARRGLNALLVERGDYGTGTSGRYHGLLHSGGRYAAKDQSAARECIVENRILRRIAPASIEDTGGYFVATPDDPEEYVEAFPAACAASEIPCEEVPVAEALRREPALNPKIRRVFALPDAAIEPWNLIEANIDDARARGSDAWSYQRAVAMSRAGDRIVSVTVRDERSGALTKIAPRLVVSAAGAWAGQIAALANVELSMRPGKGVMLIYNQRMTDTVVNRCHKSADGDIMVPVHTVAILGTTDTQVPDPDDYEVTRDEVTALVAEGEKLFPDLGRMRLMRAYAGVRPLYQPPSEAKADDRAISRSHMVLDHGKLDGVENFVSIVGGKLTTYRLMAQDTVDLVCEKLGVQATCTTADEVLPKQAAVGHGSPTYWLGHRFADHEASGGGDAELLCECEFVTRPGLQAFLDSHSPCSLDDVRRGTRLGMGPCQGGFCTFRAAGLMAERGAGSSASRGVAPGDGTGAGASGPTPAAAGPDEADRLIVGYLQERFKGNRPIAAGRQLQELWMVMGIYTGSLGVESLVDRDGSAPAARGSADGVAREEAGHAPR